MKYNNKEFISFLNDITAHISDMYKKGSLIEHDTMKALRRLSAVVTQMYNDNKEYYQNKPNNSTSNKSIDNSNKIDAMEIINALSSITIDSLYDVDYDVSMRDNLFEELEDLHNEFESRQENLQDRYDDRSCNEPEYESARERWQDALDRLEEQIDMLKEINESFYDDVLEEFDSLDGDDICSGIESVLSDYKDYNDEYKGITPIIKKFEKLIKEANDWNENGQLELVDE